MKLWSVLGNSQMLDGGAMYGNAPRPMWERWSPPDELGRIPLATRALLIEEESGRNVLLETGVGAFFDPDQRARYGVVDHAHVLLENLAKIGRAPEDVDVIVLSHLHFDHAGGLLRQWSDGVVPQLAFPNATVIASAAAWDRARHPHLRDKASFIVGLPELLMESGRLEIVDSSRSGTLGDAYSIHYSDGHTPGLLLTEIQGYRGPMVFASDLIPAMPWVHVPLSMAYDRFPERLVEEKLALLTNLLDRDGEVFFTHDPDVASGRVVRDERGRFSCVDLREAISGLGVGQ